MLDESSADYKPKAKKEQQGQEKVSRREFFKLVPAFLMIPGLPIFDILDDAYSEQKNDYLAREVIASGEIPEIVDLNELLPYEPRKFFDTLAVLPKGWRGEGPSPTDCIFPYTLHDFEKMTPIQQWWLWYAKHNIPHIYEIPPGVANTPPLKAIIPENIPELQEIKNIYPPDIRFEELLKTVSPATHPDLFPFEDFKVGGKYPERVQRLWQRIVDIAKITSVVKTLRDNYENLPKGGGKTEEIQAEIDRLNQIISNQIIPKFRDPVMLELTARTSVIHFIPDRRIFPDEKHIPAYNTHSHCYQWVVRIIDLVCWLNNTREKSPVVIKDNGMYEMRKMPSESDNQRLNINNFFDWMENESRDNGWIELTGLPYPELLRKAGEGKFIVGLSYWRRGNRPNHSYIMRIPSTGNILNPHPQTLVIAELLGGPPSGDLYLPFNPDKYDKDNKTERFFAYNY